MAPNSKVMYRTLWRWHFYAGLFCIPFIISLSITGAIYLFKPQIAEQIERPYNHESTSRRSTPVEQIAAAKAHVANAKFSSYRIPDGDNKPVVITLSDEGQRTLVFVQPYTLEVLRVIASDSQFIQIIRALHGELMLGNTGSIVIELAGCWAIILIITGLYLWWPRTGSGLAGVVYPRTRLGGRRFWRDIHAVVGFWVALFTLFLIISGLPWALVWGSAFKEIRSIGKPAISQNWNIHHGDHQSTVIDISNTLSPALLVKAENLKFAHPIELAVDRKDPSLWKLSSSNQNRMLRSDAWFNAETGELSKLKHFSDRETIDKIIGIGISAHEGHLFGWLNQLLGLIVALALILLSISGFILWQKRKPANSLGAPKVLPSDSATKTVLALTVILSILLPVVFISFIVILIIETLVLRQFSLTRDWLGLADNA